jgi:hypothetical protein
MRAKAVYIFVPQFKSKSYTGLLLPSFPPSHWEMRDKWRWSWKQRTSESSVLSGVWTTLWTACPCAIIGRLKGERVVCVIYLCVYLLVVSAAILLLWGDTTAKASYRRKQLTRGLLTLSEVRHGAGAVAECLHSDPQAGGRKSVKEREGQGEGEGEGKSDRDFWNSKPTCSDTPPPRPHLFFS